MTPPVDPTALRALAEECEQAASFLHLVTGVSEKRSLPGRCAAAFRALASPATPTTEGQMDADAMAAVWALWDHLKALGHPFDSWPDAVKDAAANAIIDKSPLTPTELQHAQEVVARLNLEGQGHVATPAGEELNLVDAMALQEARVAFHLIGQIINILGLPPVFASGVESQERLIGRIRELAAPPTALDREALVHHYKGDNSIAFWNAVNARSDRHNGLYGLGCALQALEESVLELLSRPAPVSKEP